LGRRILVIDGELQIITIALKGTTVEIEAHKTPLTTVDIRVTKLMLEELTKYLNSQEGL
jgi:3'-phosphoadenosine 5'-phosphosulfate (PAPS) 3'-phosphatase